MAASMTKAQRNELSKSLHGRLDELRDAVVQELEASGNEQYVQILDGVHDAGDASTADLLADLNLVVIDRHINEIREVEATLRRMDDDPDFGLCVECGEPIPFKRLRATPTAVRCVDCQERYERNYTTAGGRTL